MLLRALTLFVHVSKDEGIFVLYIYYIARGIFVKATKVHV